MWLLRNCSECKERQGTLHRNSKKFERCVKECSSIIQKFIDELINLVVKLNICG